MLRTIVVAVDFSPISLSSVHYAKNMALALDACLLLFHTYGQPLTINEIPVDNATLDELSYASSEKLEELKISLRHQASDELVIHTESRFGDVVDELTTVCRRLNPMVVIMSTTGHGLIHDLLFGSNTLHAMRKIDVPLIVIPPGCMFRVPKHIGLACDMRQNIEDIPASRIRELIGWFGSFLHIMYIRDSSDNMNAEYDFRTLLAASMFSDLKPKFHLSIADEIPDALTRIAEEENFAWIILMTREHGILEGLFKKSISKAMAYGGHIPLVCIHN